MHLAENIARTGLSAAAAHQVEKHAPTPILCSMGQYDHLQHASDSSGFPDSNKAAG